MIRDALLWNAEDNRVRCCLCPHHCRIGNGKYGLCSVRTNQEGKLKTINYGEITSMAMDPIEKKPLYHFMPGRRILSVGSFGCNFNCEFCQNASIAQSRGDSEYLSPEQLVAYSMIPADNIGITFTYNEPTVWFEYVYDTVRKLKESHPDRKAVLVTNGYMEPEALTKLLPYVDAMNIDLKSFRDDYYRKVCGGDVKSVQRTIKEACGKCHVEITVLLVTGLNDSAEETEEIASWLAALDPDMPLHLSRYFPANRMTRPPTEESVMIQAKKAAKKHLSYVYLGNMEDPDSSTRCPQCGRLLIERQGYRIRVRMDQPVCPGCGAPVSVVLR